MKLFEQYPSHGQRAIICFLCKGPIPLPEYIPSRYRRYSQYRDHLIENHNVFNNIKIIIGLSVKATKKFYGVLQLPSVLGDEDIGEGGSNEWGNEDGVMLVGENGEKNVVVENINGGSSNHKNGTSVKSVETEKNVSKNIFKANRGFGRGLHSKDIRRTEEHSIPSEEEKESKYFQCQFCSKTFSEATSLVDHMKYHIGDIQTKNCKIVCFVPNCLFKPNRNKAIRQKEPRITSFFVQLRSIEAHVKEKHANSTCPYCGNHYNNEKAFKDHMKNHLDPDKYFCQKCGFFIFIKKQREHMDTNICERQKLTLTIFACPDCDKGFLNFRQFNLHKKLHETAKYSFAYLFESFEKYDYELN